MKYLLLSALLLACAIPCAAKPGAPGKAGDIRSQTPAELEKTAAALKQALTAQPENVELYVQLGFTYTRLGRANDAQSAFENAVRLDPNKAIAHYMLGLIYEKKGMKDKAIASWKACLRTATEQRMKNTALKHINTLTAK